MRKLLLLIMCVFSLSATAQKKISFMQKEPNRKVGIKQKSGTPSTRSETTPLQLDSIVRTGKNVGDGGRKTTYKYNGDIISEFYSFWGEGESDHDQYNERYDLSYNERGETTLDIYYRWNQSTSKWVPERKMTWEYTATSAAYRRYAWDEEENNWIEEDKQIVGFDKNGKIIYYEVGNVWDDETDAKVPAEAKISYGDNDEVIIIINAITPSGKRNPYEKIELVPKEKFSMETKSIAYYDWDGTEWWGYDKMENNYNSKGELTEEIEYCWNGDNESWTPDRKDVYTYTIFGDEESYISFSWKENDWIETNNSKYVYQYDKQGNPLKREYYYDMNDDGVITKDDLAETANYYYSSTTGTKDSGYEDIIHIYPNPASDYIEVRLPDSSDKGKLEIISFSGSTVISRQVTSGQSVSLSNLQTGLYIYRLTDKNKVYTGKLMKKK